MTDGSYPTLVGSNPAASRAKRGIEQHTEVGCRRIGDPHVERDAQRRGGDRGDELQLVARDRRTLREGAPLEHVDHVGLPAVLVLGLVGLEVRRGRDDLEAGDQLVAVVAVVGGERAHRGTERAEREARRAGRSAMTASRRAAPVVGVGEEHVFLGGEVAEEGAGRDLAGLRDLLDRGAVEALAGEQLHGGVVQRLARARLLALPEADRSGHEHIVTHPGAWQQMQLVSLRYLAAD